MNDTKTLDSQEIFEGEKIVQIIHDGKIYTLRITKDNKLILTK